MALRPIRQDGVTLTIHIGSSTNLDCRVVDAKYEAVAQVLEPPNGDLCFGGEQLPTLLT
jgi:hypothetical protein